MGYVTTNYFIFHYFVFHRVYIYLFFILFYLESTVKQEHKTHNSSSLKSKPSPTDLRLKTDGISTPGITHLKLEGDI